MDRIRHIQEGALKDGKTAFIFALLAIDGGGAVCLLLNLVGASKTAAVLIALLLTFEVVIHLEFGLLMLVFLSYINFENVAIEFYGAPSVVKFLVLLPLAAVGIRRVLYQEKRPGWEQTAWLCGIYGAVIVASLLGTETVREGYERSLIIYVKYTMTAILMTLLIRRKTTLRRTIWTLLAAGAFMGTITSIQALTRTFHLDYMGFGQVEVQHIVGEVNDYRSGGPLASPNAFAQILMLPLALAIDRFWNESSQRLRLRAGFTVVVCVLSIIFTFSRGAFLALLVVVALMMFYHPPPPRTIITTLCLVFALSPFMPSSYTSRLQAMVDAVPLIGGNVKTEVSVRGRASEMIASWQMFRDHPFLGVGWKNHENYYQYYSRKLGLDSRRVGRVAHNLFQEVAAETGILGLLAFCAMLWAMFHGLRQAREDFITAKLPDDANLTLAFGVGMTGYLAAAFFLQNSYPRYFWLPLGIALGIPRIARNAVQTGTTDVER